MAALYTQAQLDAAVDAAVERATAALRAEIADLRAENAKLRADNAALRARVQLLEEQNAQLLAAWVKKWNAERNISNTRCVPKAWA